MYGDEYFSSLEKVNIQVPRGRGPKRSRGRQWSGTSVMYGMPLPGIWIIRVPDVTIMKMLQRGTLLRHPSMDRICLKQCIRAVSPQGILSFAWMGLLTRNPLLAAPCEAERLHRPVDEMQAYTLGTVCH